MPFPICFSTSRRSLPYERLLRSLYCTDVHTKILTLFCFEYALYFHTLLLWCKALFIQTCGHSGSARDSTQGANLNNEKRKRIPQFPCPQGVTKFLRVSPPSRLNPTAYRGNSPHVIHLQWPLFFPSLTFSTPLFVPPGIHPDKLPTPKSFLIESAFKGSQQRQSLLSNRVSGNEQIWG